MKGISFTIDIMLGIVIAFILSVTFFDVMTRSHEDPVPTAYLSRIASDTLASMDRNGTLAEMDSDRSQEVLDAVLPENSGYIMRLDAYQCSDSECDTFDLDTDLSYTIQSGTQPQETSVTARRSFLTFQNDVIDRFNNVELIIWLQ